MLKQITGTVERYKLTVIAFWVTLGTFSALYTIDNLKINTDTQNLLSEKLDWRIEYDKLKSAFPQLSDNLAIIIESQVPESAQTLSERLVYEIANAPEHFSFVSHFQSNEFWVNVCTLCHTFKSSHIQICNFTSAKYFAL